MYHFISYHQASCCVQSLHETSLGFEGYLGDMLASSVSLDVL